MKIQDLRYGSVTVTDAWEKLAASFFRVAQVDNFSQVAWRRMPEDFCIHKRMLSLTHEDARVHLTTG
jgi:hypothetical protein